MTLYEFNDLTDDAKAETVWASVFLKERIVPNYAIMLYQVDSLYVEVFYNAVENKIERFRSFINLDPLDPYLASINIDDLLLPPSSQG